MNNEPKLSVKSEDFNRLNGVFFKFLFAKEKRKYLLITQDQGVCQDGENFKQLRVKRCAKETESIQQPSSP